MHPCLSKWAMKVQGKADMIVLAKITAIFISVHLKTLKKIINVSGIFFSILKASCLPDQNNSKQKYVREIYFKLLSEEPVHRVRLWSLLRTVLRLLSKLNLFSCSQHKLWELLKRARMELLRPCDRQQIWSLHRPVGCLTRKHPTETDTNVSMAPTPLTKVSASMKTHLL